MNNEISSASICYGLYDDNKIVGFLGIIHQPHGINKKIKRITRVVILPDYQGIGLGYSFITKVGMIYRNLGYDMSIVTSSKGMIHKLVSSDIWEMRRLSANKCSSTKSAIDCNRSSMRSNCKTASFFMK